MAGERHAMCESTFIVTVSTAATRGFSPVNAGFLCHEFALLATA
jgi:hypothetical protein